MPHPVAIGTVGWTIPAAHRDHFPGEGSHLARYADCLSVVEINSTFYRSHQPQTFARWAASVPDTFRFSVKIPREITHERRLVDAIAPLEKFLADIAALGDRLGPLLVQLPPSFAYPADVAPPFFAALRERFAGSIVCEPRHPTWFSEAVDDLFRARRIARVAADPAPVPAAAEPGGWTGLIYYRLHGAPRIYFSDYSDADLQALAKKLRRHAEHAPTWCIFDNTAHAHAAANVLALVQMTDVRQLSDLLSLTSVTRRAASPPLRPRTGRRRGRAPARRSWCSPAAPTC
jgi:uncharacterized protein YecE (DUF72 family)